MDAFITSAAALHDIKNKNNSRTGSIYIVNLKCMDQMKLHLQI